MAVRRQYPSLKVQFGKVREPCYTPFMKQIITAKLKLHTTHEQFQALRTTQLAYRDALPLCQ
jgi:hypothetical protein